MKRSSLIFIVVFLLTNFIYFNYQTTDNFFSSKDNTNETCSKYKKESIKLYIKKIPTWLERESPDSIDHLMTCDCGLKCILTTNKDDARVSEGLVTIEPSRKPLPRHFPQQKRINVNVEKIRNITAVYDKYDIAVNTHPNSTIQITYATIPPSRFFEPSAMDLSGKKDEYQIVFMSSHCGVDNRDGIFKFIKKRMKVHSLGICYPSHNASILFPECEIYMDNRTENRNWMKRDCIISKFKFALQIENGIHPGYVTEKFLWSFHLPTIPVYLGAPDIDLFDPGNHSFINISNFPGTGAVVRHLRTLLRDDQLYNEYFDWKRKKFLSPNYNSLMDRNWDNIWCRLCENLSENYGK